MENAKISAIQLVTIMYIFVVGTTVIFPLAAEAEQAAWISILLGMFLGFPLLLIYHYLYKLYPHLVLTEYTIKILGTYLGTAVGISYVLFFLYGAARDVRDAMELAPLFLHGTPISVIGIMFLVPILYGLFLGIEVLLRTSEIFIVYLVLTGVLMIIFIFFSDIFQYENLLPVLEPGWKKIIGTTLKESWSAPFGEVICFTMVFAYLNKPKHQLKASFMGVIIGGLSLALFHFLTIAVLGADTRGSSISPFLRMVQKIEVAEIIQRLDALFMIWLLVNDFFKVAIFMYAAVIGGATLFKISKNVLVLPFGAIVFFTSYYFTENYISHMAQGDFMLAYIYPIFSFAIPLLLCVVTFVKKKFLK
ncbi:GerAB/ArcD/ProY family transporter [Metabacillus halosaccharovorans]|uniref:Spore germination protein n=1 Tax=Metabacillus halosaccharovorans TaxID=930124 RepID=A0ABT3DI69_9BACI|nr:spore germination protein [Metabacillus halosaccharovorans]MCV9886754.1 spore germination protein [Metabacillus halosaccharovorans]